MFTNPFHGADHTDQNAETRPDSNTVAHKLLDEVHQELRLQTQNKSKQNMIGEIIDLAYDPVTEDHRRLTGIANRLDRAAAAGDYAIIAAQQKIIEQELSRDQRDRNRRQTIDFLANDVVSVAPELGSAAISAAAKFIGGFRDNAEANRRADAKEPLHIMQKPGDYQEEITIDGQKRTYKVHVPPGYTPDKPMPAVVMLHGITENADVFADRTQMNAKADHEGFITVYPEGNPLLKNQTHLAWNVANWDIFHPARHADDVEFVGKVIDRIGQELNVDANRTYLAGFSNGGMLAQQVAAEKSDKLAAVALVGAALSGKDKAPKSPVSVIDIHGTLDPVVPYEGWDNSLGIVTMQPVTYTSDYWKAADGINDAGVETSKNGVIVRDSVNPSTGIEVKQIGIVGGMHTWPGATATMAADRVIKATDEIWDFFSHHTLGHGDLKMASASLRAFA
ncbi:MAG: alpha/beta fold hydrolase [Cyanobacteria bacterium SZAS LIN-3]|nr:alpha/beta fold hydrolase [Cyanobacteria bacterium SZAS LIN-3]MBS2008308.1 alpha/beta fold hydrolase [Cyanobacteria bacterium SZAS TMP-1]